MNSPTAWFTLKIAVRRLGRTKGLGKNKEKQKEKEKLKKNKIHRRRSFKEILHIFFCSQILECVSPLDIVHTL